MVICTCLDNFISYDGLRGVPCFSKQIQIKSHSFKVLLAATYSKFFLVFNIFWFEESAVGSFGNYRPLGFDLQNKTGIFEDIETCRLSTYSISSLGIIRHTPQPLNCPSKLTSTLPNYSQDSVHKEVWVLWDSMEPSTFFQSRKIALSPYLLVRL